MVLTTVKELSHLKPKDFKNDATNPQEDAANAGIADGDKLAELNNLQNGGKRKRRYQRGGNDHLKTEDVKAIEVDSPARETMSGPYTAQAQVTANQETGNQAMADTEYDNPGPAKGVENVEEREVVAKQRKSQRRLRKRQLRSLEESVLESTVKRIKQNDFKIVLFTKQ